MISCFTKDTLVNTNNGLIKISEIKKGDLVLTHKNRFRSVNEVYENPLSSRAVKTVKVYRTKEIKCTDNHEFLSYTTEDERLGLEPSFKPIKWLRVGDYVKGSYVKNFIGADLTIDMMDYTDLFRENWYEFKATKNTEINEIIINNDDEFIYVDFTFKKKNGSIQKGRTNAKLKRFIKIDEDFCKFLGLYYGDGHIQRSKGRGVVGIGITAKRDSENVTNFVKNFSLKYFGIEPKIYDQTHGERSWKKIMIHSKPLSIVWKHLFGALYSDKFIPDFIYKLDKSKIDNLISGLISADGNVTRKGEIRVQIANKKLIEDFHNLGRKFNYNTGITKATKREGSEQQYRLDYGINNELLKLIVKDYNDDRLYKEYKKERNKIHIKQIGNDFFYRINDIQTIKIEDEFVYDLNVDEDHSYSVENIVVHNCNLTHLEDDSFEGIENTLTKISSASKEGSGIGLLIDPLRSKESIVSSFNGNAGGVVRLADMVQAKMRFYKQGSRSGSCALYLSVWHKDIFDFLELTLPIGDEQLRTRDLFTAVIVNDLFMRQLEVNGEWYLFCPNDIKKAGLTPLYELHGEEFEAEYHKAVELGLGTKVEAKQIWDSIIKSEVESGKPYVMFKDNANKRNMQSNIGVIKQSNLCIEIFQASKPNYTPQCTLASVNLSKHSTLETIAKTTKVLTRALNCVIDKNKWSDSWSEAAGLDQRALAIGIAGMADFFAKKKISYESEEARQWNKDITETMYKAFVEESMRLAIEQGKNYPAWEGSPYSKGETYIEGWSPLPEGQPIPMLNSLGLALMPTASCSVKTTEITVKEGFISYKQLLEDNNIDWKSIEKTNSKQWFVINPIEVLTKDGEYQKTEALFYNGHAQTYKIEMEDNTILEFTGNHQFLVNRNNEEVWVKVEELLEGDDIVNIFENKYINS
jgi:ribonucleoside-diphosphate reductase alpha subunit